MQKEKFWKEFPKGTLTYKVSGSFEQINESIEMLKETYKGKEIRFSAILKNSNDAGWHIYVNVLPLSSNEAKTEEGAQK